MAFLILTRQGFDDLCKEGSFPDMPIFINPGAVGHEELARLNTEGKSIFFLPRAIDPHDQHAIQEMISFAAKTSGRQVWVQAIRNEGKRPSSETATLPQKREYFPNPIHILDQTGRAMRFLARFGFTDKQLFIIPYLGYGTAHRVTLRGRVLEEEAFRQQKHEDNSWENLAALYKRLESDQVSNARVLARFQGVSQEAITDRGGYFSFSMELPKPLDSSGWHTVDLELIAPRPPSGRPVRAQASILVPSASARFGIISDIDDTILWTNVTNKINMMLMLARSNAHTRKPFKGVPAFYRALQSGLNGNEINPIFYVSSSPWHLFTPLIEFLQKQDIPIGPLMLKELGVRKLFGSGKHRNHKLDQIEAILTMYPDLKFILIGDSGEQDPEIYTEVVKRHPQAIRCIYIRNVNPDPSRIDAIDRLIEQVRPTGTQLVLVPDSEFAAAHAASEGLIQPLKLESVRLEKEAEQASGQNMNNIGEGGQT
jgi:phosphatidate phosphatase APP1